MADAGAPPMQGWHPQVPRIIAAVDETFIWALLDRMPLPRWTFGRVTLLGDACHPMLPFMGQGAAQAIEDGAALTACLQSARRRCRGPALKLYETVRLPRASRIQQISRDNKNRFHLPDGPAQQERDARMATGTTDWSPQSIAWLYGHDACRAAGTRRNGTLTARRRVTISTALAARALAAAVFSSPRRVHGQHHLRTQSRPQNRAPHR